jgi:hypothetical protein
MKLIKVVDLKVIWLRVAIAIESETNKNILAISTSKEPNMLWIDMDDIQLHREVGTVSVHHKPVSFETEVSYPFFVYRNKYSG